MSEVFENENVISPSLYIESRSAEVLSETELKPNSCQTLIVTSAEAADTPATATSADEAEEPYAWVYS